MKTKCANDHHSSPFIEIHAKERNDFASSDEMNEL